jgi:hypothetical protein
MPAIIHPVSANRLFQATPIYRQPSHAMLRRYALHEAGHAVGAMLMGGSIVRLQIAGPMKPVFCRDGSEAVGSAAMVDTLPLAAHNELVLRRLEAANDEERERIQQVALGHVFVNVAGPAAEARLIGRSTRNLDRNGKDGAALDMATAHHHLEHLTENSKACWETISVMIIAAEELFAEPEVWAAVTAVAEAALTGIEDGEELMARANQHLPKDPLFEPLLSGSDGIGSLKAA